MWTGRSCNPERPPPLHALWLGDAGIDPWLPPKVVQRLGHSSISVTMARYSHVIEGMDRAAAEAVAALIEQSSG